MLAVIDNFNNLVPQCQVEIVKLYWRFNDHKIYHEEPKVSYIHPLNLQYNFDIIVYIKLVNTCDIGYTPGVKMKVWLLSEELLIIWMLQGNVTFPQSEVALILGARKIPSPSNPSLALKCSIKSMRVIYTELRCLSNPVKSSKDLWTPVENKHCHMTLGQ
jgi:hypothetical protein